MREDMDSLRALAKAVDDQLRRPGLFTSLLDDNDRLLATIIAMRDRDDRNGSLPPWYREQIDAALAARIAHEA